MRGNELHVGKMKGVLLLSGCHTGEIACGAQSSLPAEAWILVVLVGFCSAWRLLR